jgi:hypothetical protein
VSVPQTLRLSATCALRLQPAPKPQWGCGCSVCLRLPAFCCGKQILDQFNPSGQTACPQLNPRPPIKGSPLELDLASATRARASCARARACVRACTRACVLACVCGRACVYVCGCGSVCVRVLVGLARSDRPQAALPLGANCKHKHGYTQAGQLSRTVQRAHRTAIYAPAAAAQHERARMLCRAGHGAATVR